MASYCIATFLFCSALWGVGGSPEEVRRLIQVMVMVAFCLHSAKGGAVETGCSELYDVIY